jgi:Protein of unknown function (DUF3515)
VNAGAVARQVLVSAAAMALLHGCSSDPGAVEIGAQTPAADDQDACRTLLDALPDQVADQPVRPVEPEDGWGAAWGDPAIVLTCGGPPPEGFRRTSSCTTVNGVDWFVPDEQLETTEATDLTMTTVHREQFVEVRMPAEYWPPAATLADLSASVSRSIEATGACV